MTQKSVIVLWGKKRNPSKEEANKPTSVDKGVRELSASGYDVVGVFPGRIRENIRHALGDGIATKIAFALATIEVIFRAKASKHAVIYTTDSVWTKIVSVLKAYKIVDSRFVVKWAGNDVDTEQVLSSPRTRRFYRRMASAMDACWIISQRNVQDWQRIAPDNASKFVFWPTGVDISYYRELRGKYGSSQDAGLVVVGSDICRDWPIAVRLAEEGETVTFLTEDPRVASLVAPIMNRPNFAFHYKIGFEESAKILLRARAILVTTVENNRFSGSTTVGVAGALGKPLILDEPYDLEAYGLRDGFNCIIFKRGDYSSLRSAIARLRDTETSTTVAENLSRQASYFDVADYAEQVARSLDASWKSSNVEWQAEGKAV